MTQRNVKDYGAKGDGEADDTDAIQLVLDGSAAGDSVLIPAGAYELRQKLHVPDGVTIDTESGTVLEYPERLKGG